MDLERHPHLHLDLGHPPHLHLDHPHLHLGLGLDPHHHPHLPLDLILDLRHHPHLHLDLDHHPHHHLDLVHRLGLEKRPALPPLPAPLLLAALPRQVTLAEMAEWKKKRAMGSLVVTCIKLEVRRSTWMIPFQQLPTSFS